MKPVASQLSLDSSDFPRRLAAARRGSRRAQNALFQRYYPQVERIAHAQLRRGLGGRRLQIASRFSTADIVQDVFHSLLGNLAAFEGTTEGEFVVYVSKVVRSRTLDAIRFHGASRRDYRRNLRAPDGESLGGMAATPKAEASSGVAADLVGRYETVLRSLPEAERRLLAAKLERGLTYEALAGEFGYPSRYSARRAFFAAQARLVVRLGLGRPQVEESGRALLS